MKIKLNSSNYTVELKDQTPFIQGTDDIRNIIELYCEPNFVTDAVISYVYQNGRSSIAMPNNTKTLTTFEGANYELILFRLPNIATANSGQLMASIVVTTADGKHKFNITNSVLKASDFETFEEALEGTAAEVRASISAMSESISEVENDLTAFKLRRDNPHEVTKAQVGLGNVDDTSDADKPISDATRAALEALDSRIDSLGVIAEMPEKIVEVANCFEFENDESSVDLDNANIDNATIENADVKELTAEAVEYGEDHDETKTKLYAGADGFNVERVLNELLLSRFKISNHVGYLDSFEFQYGDPDNPSVINVKQLLEIAQGKTSNYVIDDTVTGPDTVNSSFNSSNASIVINISPNDESYNKIKDVNNKSIYLYDLKIGDIVSVTQNNVPDRWVGNITSTQITFYALESKLNIDSIPTQNSVNLISSGGVYNALLGKVDKTDIGYIELSGSSGTLTDGQFAETQKAICIIKFRQTTGIYDYYQKYFSNDESQIKFTKIDIESTVTPGVVKIASEFININVYNKNWSKSYFLYQGYGTLKINDLISKSNYHLGSFDSVSGNVITRQTGYLYLNKSNANWTINGNSTIYYTTIVSGSIDKPSADNVLGNIICPTLETVTINDLYFEEKTSGIAINTSGSIGISASDYANLTEIVIQYKLATPYTETIIENQPLNTLDQKGSKWLRNEWEKGLNLWDEQWQNGVWSYGSFVSNNDYVASKNYIEVKPNTTYSYSNGTSGADMYIVVEYFDASKAYLSREVIQNNSSFTTPSTAYYIQFYVNDVNRERPRLPIPTIQWSNSSRERHYTCIVMGKWKS